MISFGNAASSHSGLIPLKTAYKKRVELLRAISSKKNFINLHSAAFVTVFHLIWSMPTNLAFFKKPPDNFFYKFCNPETWKQCQWIMRTLTCKHKTWGENWLYLRPYLKAFSVLNVLETFRVYLLAIDLTIVKFIKKNYRAVFWKLRNL